MAQRHGALSAKQLRTLSKVKFSYLDDNQMGIQTPWKAAFPNTPTMGYSDSFTRRCSQISPNKDGIVDEETARNVWLSILRDYEDYIRIGMWIQEQVLEEHRQVARELRWYSDASP